MFKIIVVLLILHNGHPVTGTFDGPDRYATMAACDGIRLSPAGHELVVETMEFLSDEGLAVSPAAKTRCVLEDRPA